MKYFICILLLASQDSWGQNGMPCESINNNIAKHLSYYNKNKTTDFLKCVEVSRTCAVAGNKVFSAQSIKKLPKHSSHGTTLVIVQSPNNVKTPLCLIGVYSGGSSASWIFEAYKIVNNKPMSLKGMYKARAYGDAVSPKDAALVTYKMYEKYADK